MALTIQTLGLGTALVEDIVYTTNIAGICVTWQYGIELLLPQKYKIYGSLKEVIMLTAGGLI